MLATLHWYSKKRALDVWKQVMVNSISDRKFKCFFRMEPVCNSVDLFSFILLGNGGACPQDTFQISVAWFCLNKAETLSKKIFFLTQVCGNYMSTWKIHLWVWNLDWALYLQLHTEKKASPNLKIKPDTPIGYLDNMYTGLRHKWMNLKAIYSCFI